jgi:predicted dithiol-disulfide oxidoreductase (DUF899 family)
MKKLHNKKFPNENRSYRTARNKLLEEETKLRKKVEQVAALRRKLPNGGKVKDDYVFKEGGRDLNDTKTVKQVKLSELFSPGKDTLIIYGFMYKLDDENLYPLCTSILDGMNGQSLHVRDRVNFAVVSRAPLEKLRRWAQKRGWNNLRLLSSFKNSFNSDYHAEDDKGFQLPALNIFRQTPEGIYHFYNTELLYTKSEKGQDGRHVDMIWPLWNMFDFTPDGRGTDWYPKFEYKIEHLSAH